MREERPEENHKYIIIKENGTYYLKCSDKHEVITTSKEFIDLMPNIKPTHWEGGIKIECVD